MALLPTLLAAVALAQETRPDADATYGFDAHGFRWTSAAADPRAPLRFLRPGDAAGLGGSAGAVAEYANRPLVFDSGGDAVVLAPGSSNLAAVNLAAGFVPTRAVRIDVSLPVILANTYRTTPSYDRLEATASGGPTAGDLRASALAAVLTPAEAGGVGLGVVGAIDLPTGAPERWLGTRGPAGLLALAGTYEREALALSAQVGGRLAPNRKPDEYPAPTLGGDTAELAGGASWLVDEALGVGVEAQTSIPVSAAVRAAIGIPAEATLTGRYVTADGAHVAAGLGVGLGKGAGASPIRLVVGGGFGTPAGGPSAPGAPAGGGRDRDLDGVKGDLDRCPEAAETPNGVADDDGCPDELPTVTFEAHLRSGEVDEIPSETVLRVTKPDGTTQEGQTRVTVAGPPGAALRVVATYGACRGAVLDSVLPPEGHADVRVDLGRLEGTVAITTRDRAGRRLPAVARYVISDEFCKPAEAALAEGAGTHTVGTGPVKLYVTAPGYSTFQDAFTLTPGETHAVDAVLEPTLVSVKDGAVRTTVPLGFVGARLDDRSLATVSQVVSLVAAQSPPPRIEVRALGDGADALARAQAVVDALSAGGLDPARLSAVLAGPPTDPREVVSIALLPP